MSVTAKLDPDGKHIRLGVEYRYKELCKSIPGSSWSTSDQIWRVPLSWSTCLALRSTFKDDLVIEDDLSEWAFNQLNERITPANDLRDLEEFEDPNNQDLFPHQRAGVKFLSTAKQIGRAHV